MEFSAKDANKLFFHNQDGTCHIALHILSIDGYNYVKIIGTLDMSVQTAVQLYITDQLTATVMDLFYFVDAVHAILMKSVNFQELAFMFKYLRVLSLAVVLVSFVANLQFGRLEMTTGEIATVDKILNSSKFSIMFQI